MAASERPDQRYRITILNSPAINAFALPSGQLYITRGLIALRDTRTPLITNICQLAGRAALLTLLIGRLGVVAIPAAFAISAGAEALALGCVLLVKLRRRIR